MISPDGRGSSNAAPSSALNEPRPSGSRPAGKESRKDGIEGRKRRATENGQTRGPGPAASLKPTGTPALDQSSGTKTPVRCPHRPRAAV